MDQPHWTDKINISEAAKATRKNRATVAHAVRHLPAENGPGNAKYYDTWRLLQALYIGEGGPTYSEAHRLLTIARTKLVEKEIQAKDEKTMPVEAYRESFQYYVAIFRQFCLSHEGKTLSPADTIDAHRALIDFMIRQLPESEQAANRAAFEDSILDATAERIKSVRSRVERDEHGLERERLGRIVQMAYSTAKDSPTRENLDALEAAWDAASEHHTKSSEHKYVLEHQPEMVISEEKRKAKQAEWRASLLAG
jgi:hypothetical protein